MPRQFRTRHSCELDGARVEYELVRTVGRRAVHIVVGADGVEVRVPYHFPAPEAHAALGRNAGWVTAQVQRVEARRPSRLGPGVRIPYLGETLAIEFGPPRRPIVERAGTVLRVARPRASGDSERDAPVRAAIERWYREEARVYFTARIEALAPVFTNREPSRLSVRGQRTRWGSCSTRGAVSLNWRLMLLDPMLVDYVIAHELCHLVHMNHSAAFWRLLECGMPDYRARRSRLSDAGPLAL